MKGYYAIKECIVNKAAIFGCRKLFMFRILLPPNFKDVHLINLIRNIQISTYK